MTTKSNHPLDYTVTVCLYEGDVRNGSKHAHLRTIDNIGSRYTSHGAKRVEARFAAATLAELAAGGMAVLSATRYRDSLDSPARTVVVWAQPESALRLSKVIWRVRSASAFAGYLAAYAQLPIAT